MRDAALRRSGGQPGQSWCLALLLWWFGNVAGRNGPTILAQRRFARAHDAAWQQRQGLLTLDDAKMRKLGENVPEHSWTDVMLD